MIHREEMVKNLRREYPEGTRVKLIRMFDDPRPVASGTLGTVRYVDDAGTIHVNWDNGRTLGVVYGEDQITVVKQLIKKAGVEPAFSFKYTPIPLGKS